MNRRSNRRLVALRLFVVVLLVVLGGRLWYLQVPAGHRFAQAAADNRTRQIITPAPRGEIVDDQGRPLAVNRTALVVSVDGYRLAQQPDGGSAVLHRLARLIGQPYDELRRRIRPCGPGVTAPCWNGSPLQPVPVLEDAPTRIALRIAEHREDFPGVSADYRAIREYPHGTPNAHLIGHLAPITAEQLDEARYAGYRDSDLVGSAGLEEQYDRRLRGKDGVRTLAVDHAGHVTGTVSDVPPTPGGTLVTHIDARLQRLATTALHNGIKAARADVDAYGRHYRADSGAVVVLDAQTGAVLAMTSYPSYDPNVWTGGISQRDYDRLTAPSANEPLLSRATDGEFSPGSTFKVVSTSAAIRSGFPLHGTYDCPGAVTIGNRLFHNYEGIAYGPMSLREALIKSCDTVFYPLAVKDWQRDGGLRPAPGQPKEIFAKTARAYGFGTPTGIDLPTEAAGRIPDRRWKKDFWQERRADYCAGAKNPRFDALHRRADGEFCHYGYLYQPGDAANFAIGQGDVLVTPLQLAAAYGALATGVLRQPQVGAAVISPTGKVTWRNSPKVVRRLPVKPSTLRYIRSALRGVPELGGTAYSAFAGWPQDRVPVAAKTGTAEVGLSKSGRQDTSWFASFAPAGHPRFVVVTMLEEVGGHYTAQIARDVYSGIFGVGLPAIFPGGRPPTGLPHVPAAEPAASGRRR